MAGRIPTRRASNLPPAPCSRCGGLTEGPLDMLILREGEEVTGTICEFCYELSFTNPREFWDRGWKRDSRQQ